MEEQSNFGQTISSESFRARLSSGSSFIDPANGPEFKDAGSDEDAEVYIGPVTTRFVNCENHSNYRSKLKHISEPQRCDRSKIVCRYYLSPTGCQRVNCKYKHENPENTESEFNTSTTLKAPGSGTLRGDFGVEQRMNLRTTEKSEKNELARKVAELEKEIEDLRNRTKDIDVLREENFNLRRLLEGNGYQQFNQAPHMTNACHEENPGNPYSTYYLSWTPVQYVPSDGNGYVPNPTTYLNNCPVQADYSH